VYWFARVDMIVFGVVSTLVVEAHDRKVLERGERFYRR
jgi:hypothetical protein